MMKPLQRISHKNAFCLLLARSIPPALPALSLTGAGGFVKSPILQPDASETIRNIFLPTGRASGTIRVWVVGKGTSTFDTAHAKVVYTRTCAVSGHMVP